MTSQAEKPVYQDLSSACNKIDKRKTNYRFDTDTDVCWDRVDEPGLYFGPEILGMLGIDLSVLCPEAVEAFQWAYAMAICESFYDLEEMVVRFTQNESSDLGSSRSVTLLCEEEQKHMMLFERYGEVLRSQQPAWAVQWENFRPEKPKIPGSPEDNDAYPDKASYHFIFWINTLFFEEFTIFLHECLHVDQGLIHPTWASVHECHKKEEVQHLVTDVVHIKSLALSSEQRELLSKVFFFRLEKEFESLFGLRRALGMLVRLYPEAEKLVTPPFRALPIFREVLLSRIFRRTREAAPHIAALAKEIADVQPPLPPENSIIRGELLKKFSAEQLSNILRRSATRHPSAVLTYLNNDGSEHSETYAELLLRSERISGELRLCVPQHTRFVVLLLENPRDFVAVFWACQLAGLVPVPAAVPSGSAGLMEDRRVSRLHSFLGSPLIVTDNPLAKTAPPGWHIAAIEKLDGSLSASETISAEPSDIALLQFSSGSTSEPRGVVLTQQNVLTNLSAITRYLEVTEGDSVVSWMPLNHDMGLCLHLASVYSGLPQVLMATRLFVRRPGSWLQGLHAHKATITASPNFGLVLATRKAIKGKLYDIDLSSVRCILNGAEPISLASAEAFLEMLRPAGLDRNVMLACYGLAEATTAVTLNRPGEGLSALSVSRKSLQEGREVEKLPAEHPDAIKLVDVGQAIPGVEVRISYPGEFAPTKPFVGEIEIRGPNVTAGYWNDTLSSTNLRHGGWVRTGDLGFIREQRLYVAGRKKNVIFVNGRKFLAEDLEESLRKVPGISGERLAVLGSIDPNSGAEQILVFLHHRSGPEQSRRQVADAASAHLADLLKYPVYRVIFLRSDKFPLTTSGKVQRYRLREAYERGDFGESGLSDAVAKAVAVIRPPNYAEGTWSTHIYDMISRVRAVWAEVLNRPLEAVDVDRNFFELGGTSLQAVEIHCCLEEQWGEMLDQRILLDCRTVREQTEFLMNLPERKERTDNRAKSINSRQTSDDDIAVIAMAGRFPGANDLEGFWELLREGRYVYREPPADRWDADQYYDPDVRIQGKTVCRTASFLDDIKKFDALACGLSEEEVRLIDPQQRLFLEIVLDLVDQAYLSSRRVGIFAGAAENEYFSRLASLTESINRYSAQTNLANMLSARLSQLLRLTGPAFTLDAACATSLVAVHYACRSLQSGECDVAIAGGVQLNLSVVPQLIFSQAGVLSGRGRCQPYAKDADGFVPGEGAGAVLLKPVNAAIRDGDPMLGVICGSAINNDGGAMSQMAPNPAGQVDVINAALADAGIHPEDISYVEGHGAGTRIGDLVEVRALTEAFKESPLHSVGLGSVKSNVGHLFHAAGICSLIKVLLALRKEELPPTVGCEEPYPKIQFEQTPFFPVQSVRPWKRTPAGTRFAGISAFGVGGTNCHVVVAQPPEHQPKVPDRVKHLLCLSAPGPEQLKRVGEVLANALETDPSWGVADFCATANQRANRFRYRSAVLAGSREEALEELRGVIAGFDASYQPRLMFMFSGPAAQYAGMGLHLLEEPAFAAALDECDSKLRPLLGCSIRELLTNEEYDLNQIGYAQPVSFAFGYAVARWLQSLGVIPDAVLGHSGGEYAAASIAGVFSVEEAARLAYARGLAMQRTEPGRMVVVYANAARVRPLLSDSSNVEVACINSYGQCLISGSISSVDQAREKLEQEGLQTDGLALSCAAHSSLMQVARADLRSSLITTEMRTPGVTFFSTVTGVQQKDFNADYWLDQLTAPVLFESAVVAALDAGYRHFVDLGPSAVLSQFVRETSFNYQQGSGRETGEIRLFPVMRRSLPGWEPTLDTLGQLFKQGIPLDTAGLDRNCRSGANLPSYPYDRKTLWVEPPPIDYRGAAFQLMEQAADSIPVQSELDLVSCPFIRDHRVFGNSTAPSALLLDIVLSQLNSGKAIYMLEDVLIERPLALTPGSTRKIRVRRMPSGERMRVVLETGDENGDEAWVTHLSAHAVLSPRQSDDMADRVDVPAVMARCLLEIPPGWFHHRVAQAGMEYGPSLDTIMRIKAGTGEVVAQLQLPETQSKEDSNHVLQPGLVDGAIRSIAALLPEPNNTAEAPFLGFSIRRVRVRHPVTHGCLAHVRLHPNCVLDGSCEVIRCDVTIIDSKGCVLAKMEEVCLKKQDAGRANYFGRVNPRDARYARCYAFGWRPADSPIDRDIGATGGGTFVIGAPTPIRIDLEYQIKEAEGMAFALTPPVEAVPWSGVFPATLMDPSQIETMRIVLMASKVEDLSSLAVAMAKSGINRLEALLVVSPDASIMAFLRSLALEHPGWNCRGIQADAQDIDAAILYRETRAVARDLVVSYREGHRFEPVLTVIEPVAIESPLRRAGVYWITGGMGSLGRVIAEAMARSAGARIFLTGRRSNFDDHVLKRIKSAGGDALYFECDVTDTRAMERARALILQKWGQLNGVIHTAGSVDDSLVAFSADKQSNDVIRTKFEGARVLAEVTKDDELDFLVFFSSLVALTGMPGQTEYAAANAAMDSLAHMLHSQGRRVKSFNWGPWAIGMAADDRYQRLYKSKNIRPFSAEAGAGAFLRALSCDAVQISIIDIDSSSEADQLAEWNKVASFSDKTAASVGSVELPPSGLSDDIKTLVAKHLHCSPEVLATSTPFRDLGIDSLMAVDIALEIQEYLGVRLQPTLLLELRTMAELEKHLEVLTNQEGKP